MSDPGKGEVVAPHLEGETKRKNVDLESEKEKSASDDLPESPPKNAARKKRKDDLEVTIAPDLESTSDIALGPPR